MNPWESSALQYHYPEPPAVVAESTGYDVVSQPRTQNGHYQPPRQAWRSGPAYDPSGIIYPGLYSASGLDVMRILIRVATRPNPKIELGPIDGNCALVVCDLQATDTPIVYANDSFCELTGYTLPEILGKNCRFLQSPPGHRLARGRTHDPAAKRMREALANREEIQLDVLNYKKNGQAFVNILSLVPIPEGEITTEVAAGTEGPRYYVGFQVDRDA